MYCQCYSLVTKKYSEYQLREYLLQEAVVTERLG